MNFIRPLATLCLAATLPAQTIDAQAKGGGELKIDGTLYHFELKALYTAPPKGGLPGAFRIQGRLVPEDQAQALDLDLTVLKTGTLYMLRILRKGPGGYPDTWSATGKTRARITLLEDHFGGRLEIACSGPLTGVIGRRPKTTTWRGSLWVILP